MKQLLITAVLLIFSLNLFSQNTLYFPITHHIINKDDGSGGVDPSIVPDIMSELNKAFAPANIQFFLSCVTTRSNDD